jgi:peptidyl-prolyl cis-trans isomerase A (cyclophilin A)
MKQVLILLLAVFFFSCNEPSQDAPRVVIDTNYGDIEVELYPEKAPVTVAAFLSYVDAGLYTNSAFYRVVLAEGMSTEANVGLIQGGTWQTNDKAALPGIAHETTQKTGLSHTNGTISLARTDTGTANTEFFICIGDQSQFDYGNSNPADGQGFAAFGRVINGMKVVRTIQLQKKQGESFTQKITIRRIRRT